MCIYICIYIYMDILPTRTRFLIFQRISLMHFYTLPIPRIRFRLHVTHVNVLKY